VRIDPQEVFSLLTLGCGKGVRGCVDEHVGDHANAEHDTDRELRLALL